MIIQKTIHISPYKQNQIVNGDKVLVKIDSSLDELQIKSYISKRILDKFYILKFLKNDEGKFYEVFALSPAAQPQGQLAKENSNKKEEIFTVSDDFQFKFDQNRLTQEFISLETKYEEVKETPLWQTITVIALCLITIILLLKLVVIPIRKKLKLRARRRAKAQAIIKQLESVQTREDFENIYRIRTELQQLLEYDSYTLKKFFQKLNEIQYKKNWSEEEKQSLESIFRQIGEVRFKDGV